MKTKTEYLCICPKCKRIFDSDVTFGWKADSHGDPTIEVLSCPYCPASTHPIQYEQDYCGEKIGCDTVDGEDDICFNYDEFNIIPVDYIVRVLEKFAKMHRDGCELSEIACERGIASDKTIITNKDFLDAQKMLSYFKDYE